MALDAYHIDSVNTCYDRQTLRPTADTAHCRDRRRNETATPATFTEVPTRAPPPFPPRCLARLVAVTDTSHLHRGAYPSTAAVPPRCLARLVAVTDTSHLHRGATRAPPPFPPRCLARLVAVTDTSHLHRGAYPSTAAIPTAVLG